jgi:hypothetical protein
VISADGMYFAALMIKNSPAQVSSSSVSAGRPLVKEE